jgi:hypothetical protein
MNIEIESAFADWLRSLPAFDGVVVLSGQSSEEIPGDQPVVVVGVETTDVIALSLYKVTASVVIATPSILEGSLELHSGLAASLRTCLLSASTLGAAFPANMTLAGAVLSSLTESRESEQWLNTASITLGIVAPI